MKTIITVILTALSMTGAHGVEYVTLNSGSSVKEVAPTDLVEIVGCTNIRDTFGTRIRLDFSNERQVTFEIGGTRNFIAGNAGASVSTTLGHKFTGLVAVRTFGEDTSAVTLKITSASEINAVTPSSVLVLPENSTGDFDVIIESSSDLVSWLPFFSQTVNSQTARRFFRTRVVRSAVQPPLRPVEPNGGDSDR